MKKLLLILILLLSIIMVSCKSEDAPVPEVSKERLEAREELVHFIGLFGEAEEEDFEYEEVETLYTGAANCVFYDSSSINAMILEGHKQIAFTLSVAGETLNYLNIERIELIYQNDDRNIYTGIYYYQYKLFSEEYITQPIEATPEEFIKFISVLTMEDYEWILGQLGY